MDVEKLVPHALHVGMWASTAVENTVWLLKKSKHEITVCQQPLLGVHTAELKSRASNGPLCIHGHSSSTHNRQRGENRPNVCQWTNE